MLYFCIFHRPDSNGPLLTIINQKAKRISHFLLVIVVHYLGLGLFEVLFIYNITYQRPTLICNNVTHTSESRMAALFVCTYGRKKYQL
jgi:hypothetical protein